MRAWLILPALAIGYLLAAPGPLRRRLWHLGTAGAVMLALSLSWIGLYTFTPARDLPHISGSTDNSAVAMVFGWNGLLRFGVHLPGTPDFTFSSGGPGHYWGQLLGGRLCPQIGCEVFVKLRRVEVSEAVGCLLYRVRFAEVAGEALPHSVSDQVGKRFLIR